MFFTNLITIINMVIKLITVLKMMIVSEIGKKHFLYVKNDKEFTTSPVN